MKAFNLHPHSLLLMFIMEKIIILKDLNPKIIKHTIKMFTSNFKSTNDPSGNLISNPN